MDGLDFFADALQTVFDSHMPAHGEPGSSSRFVNAQLPAWCRASDGSHALEYRIAEQSSANTRLFAHYQWDAGDFFAEQPYESRLDYAEEGLGPVFTDHDGLIDHIVTGSYRGSTAEYEQRREHFFEGVDIDRINDTIIERMLSL